MTNPLPTAAAYVPTSLTRAALNGTLPTFPYEPRTERFSAAILFADVSGFTPLTEALGQKGSEGPEELTRLLNRYFGWMIAFVEAQGGEVVKFGGDALTVVFPAVDESLAVATRRAMQAAESMQSAMDEFGVMESSVGLVALKLKIAIGAGPVISAFVGGVRNRWEYIIAGDPLRQTAQAERQAKKGEIVLSPEAEVIIDPNPHLPKPLSKPDWDDVQDTASIEDALRYYIPSPVSTWLDQDLHQWLATLRPMSVLFAGVSELDYEKPETIDRLHRFIQSVQEITHHYQGAVARLTVDDKGTVLLILFGAPPESHEDDPERAVRCAMDLQTSASRQNLGLAVGVTTGRVFAGPVGGDTRREYTVMGDAVNVAARLMVLAGTGQIYCNYETYRSAANQIKFKHSPPQPIKGKAGLVSIYSPIGEYHPTEQIKQIQLGSNLLLGRQESAAKSKTCLDEVVQHGATRIMVIEGEAGIGKSQLVKATIRHAQKVGFSTLLGLGRSIDQETPYRAWRDIFYTYFQLDPAKTTLSELQRQIQTEVSTIAPELAVYTPLLNDVLRLNIVENSYTASLDPASRQDKLFSLIAALLEIEARKKPVLLILEDIHWLDPLSWKLAVQLAVAAIKDQIPVMLILVTRPIEKVTMRTEATMLSALEETVYLRLSSLPSDETLTIGAMKLGFTSHDLPEAVTALIRQRAGGNPFFAEEIFYMLHEYGFVTFKALKGKVRCLISGDLNRAAQTLPATVQNVILARIDRLPPEKQLILRIAAVIGQMFAFNILHDTLNQYLTISSQLLKHYLSDLIHLGLIEEEVSSPDLSYKFKQAIIREVTYQSVLFDRRRQLHRSVAKWYEDTFTTDTDELFLPSQDSFEPDFLVTNYARPKSTRLAPYYSLLVYHWHQAEDEKKEGYYAAIIGQKAAAEYAHAEAIAYLNRALDLIPITRIRERYNLLLARETVYHRLGDRERQSIDLDSMIEVTQQIDDPLIYAMVAFHQGNYAEAVSNYSEAAAAAQTAIDYAQQAKSIDIECNSYLMWGQTLLHQFQYPVAFEKLEHGLRIARDNQSTINEAKILAILGNTYAVRGDYLAGQACVQRAIILSRVNNWRPVQAESYKVLGFIHYNLDKYELARAYYEQAIRIYHSLGDKRGELKVLRDIGLIYLNRGAYEAARDYFEQTLDTGREIADRLATADALSNLSLMYCKVGDFMPARSYLGQALGIYEEIGSRAGEADALNRLGIVYFYSGDYQTTKRYCELALSIYRSIGNRRAESCCLIYLGHALRNLNQLQTAETVYQQALSLCKEVGAPGLRIDVLVSLADIALFQNQSAQALQIMDEVLTWLDDKGTAGIDNLARVYLKSYKILTAEIHKQSELAHRAYSILNQAYHIVQEQASVLKNKQQKRNFLEQVRWNQEIIKLWLQEASLPNIAAMKSSD